MSGASLKHGQRTWRQLILDFGDGILGFVLFVGKRSVQNVLILKQEVDSTTTRHRDHTYVLVRDMQASAS